MDFNLYKNFNWETLKRIDLGNSYQKVFHDIYTVLSRTSNLLQDFERTYSDFVGTDRQKIDLIFNNLSILINKVTSFAVPNGETLDQSIARAKELQEEVKTFYEQSLPKISELQTYFRSELKTKADQEILNQQNDIQSLITETHNTLNNKLNDVVNTSSNQKSQIDASVREAKDILTSKVSEIDRVHDKHTKEVNSFLNQARETFEKRLEELEKKLFEANSTISTVIKTKNDVEALNKSIKDFSIVEATGKFGTIFKEEAEKNLRWGRLYGLVFILLISIAIAIIYFWFIPLVKEFNQADVTKGLEYYYVLAFLVRLTVLFFVSWIMKEVLRNCNSNLHMYNVNIHRHNSLKSFEILVQNNKLEENRDAIVKQIAQTIFGEQDDGYLAKNKNEIKVSDIINLINATRK